MTASSPEISAQAYWDQAWRECTSASVMLADIPNSEKSALVHLYRAVVFLKLAQGEPADSLPSLRWNRRLTEIEWEHLLEQGKALAGHPPADFIKFPAPARAKVEEAQRILERALFHSRRELGLREPLTNVFAGKMFWGSLLCTFLVLFAFGPGRRMFRNKPYELTVIHQDWGVMREDQSVEGNFIRMNGQRYSTGIGTHANSSIRMTFKPQYTVLSGMCGIDDEVAKGGTAECEIVAGDQTLFRASVKGDSAPVSFEVPVQGLTDVLLNTKDGGDKGDGDHVDWANLVLK